MNVFSNIRPNIKGVPYVFARAATRYALPYLVAITLGTVCNCAVDCSLKTTK